jgi:hypothetical protein
MGNDMVNLPAELINNREFLEDCARFSEQILTQAQIVKKYRLDAETLDRLGSDDALVEAIERVKVHRLRSGQCMRERAQVLVATAPQRLGEILNSGGSPRHVIESAKILQQFAAGPEATAAAPVERFVIQINMGNGEVVTYDSPKTIEPNASSSLKTGYNTTENTVDQLSTELIPFVVAKKKDSGNGGDFL